MVDISSGDKNINITVSTSGNKASVNATPDTAMYYSNKSREWAISDKIVDNEDYSSKYYAAKSKESAELSGTYADNANGYLQDMTVNYTEYMENLTNSKNTALDEISTLNTSSLAEIETAKTGALTDIDTLHVDSVNDITNLKNTSLSEIETTKTNAISDITNQETLSVDNVNTAGQTQVDTIKSTGETEYNKIITTGIDYKASIDLDNLSEVGEKHILSLVYPIGSIYISVNEIDPSSLFGFGQWEKIKDKFLLASGDNYTNEETGGSSTVSLTTNQMPTHNHTASTDSQGAHTHSRGSMNITGNSGQVYAYKPAGNGGGAMYQDLGGGGCAQDSRNTYTGSGAIGFNAANNWSGETSSNGSHTHNITVYNTGAGEAHNNMPPYLAVNIWKRVA